MSDVRTTEPAAEKHHENGEEASDDTSYQDDCCDCWRHIDAAGADDHCTRCMADAGQVSRRCVQHHCLHTDSRNARQLIAFLITTPVATPGAPLLLRRLWLDISRRSYWFMGCWQIFRVHQSCFRPKLRAGPRCQLTALPRPSRWFKGVYFEREGEARERGKGRGEEGKEGNGERFPLRKFLDPCLCLRI